MQSALSSNSQIGNSATVQVNNAVGTTGTGKVYVKIKNILFNTSDFSANGDKEPGQQQQQR
jgi:hypothetical protein